MAKEYPLKKYVPGLGMQVGIVSDEIKFIEKSGSGTVSVGATSTVDVTITHDEAFILNIVPEATTTTASCTVAIGEVKAGSFVLKASNSTAGALNVDYSWTRVGL